MPPPYKVSLHKDTGIYIFTTEHGLDYACVFRNVTPKLSPILGVYDLEIHEFEFRPSGKPPEGKDERISATVVSLLEKFFQSPLRVLIYLCDSADGRGRERQSLFRQWYKNIADIYRDELNIGIEDDVMVHGCILTRKDFPHGEVLQTELKDKARGIMVEKYGG